MSDEREETLDQGEGLVPQPGARANATGTEASELGGAESTGPRSIEEAFKLVRENDRAAAQGDVPEPEGNVSAADSGADDSGDGGSAASVPQGSGSAPVGEDQPTREQPQQPQRQQQVGSDPLDNLLKQFQRQAVEKTRNDFQQQELRRMTLGDLYERDEQTGRVTFYNPDDPNHPFASRVEAQAFVDAYNRSYDEEERSYAQQSYQEILEQNRDVVELVAFNPVYEKMQPEVREKFEALLAPYEKQHPDGTITFPGAQFQILAQQAYNLAMIDAKRQAQVQTQQQQAQPQAQQPQRRGPALDLKGGSTAKDEYKQPTTMSEAFAIVNQQRADERKKGKGRK